VTCRQFLGNTRQRGVEPLGTGYTPPKEGQMGNTKAYFIALCIVVATVGQCFAQVTGNEILKDCQVNLHNPNSTMIDAQNIAFCQGFLWAIQRVGYDLTEPYRFCRPDEGTLKQGSLVLLKYLNDHPEQLHEDAVLLAVRAFRAAWPCQ
jgi:hypothetical protein